MTPGTRPMHPARAMRSVGDVSSLPDYAFGASTLGWWGVVGFILIEGMGFVMAIGAYYYLLPNEHPWPPSAPPPPLGWALAFTLLAIASELPNVWVKRAAKREDLRTVRWLLLAMTVIGLVLIGLRFGEMAALNVRWDRNAYGSIVWALVLLHAFHLITDVWDTGVLAAVFWFRKVDGRKFSDVADNALYWHFIVWSWVVLFAVVYGTPRWV